MGRNSHLFAALYKARAHLHEQMLDVEHGDCLRSYAKILEDEYDRLFVQPKILRRFYKEQGLKV